MSWHKTPITLLAKALEAKQVSSTELTQYFLDRIAAGKVFNAYLDVNPELSLAQAAHADTLRAAGKAGKLTGIPIAHKDVFVTRGWKSTAASKMLENYQSPFDATVVANLGMPNEANSHGAGMVCLGKTNMDEFAMGSSNENSAYGPVLNPWNTDYVAGGSSGGSAAAVAAGLAPIATGTDTGGEGRGLGLDMQIFRLEGLLFDHFSQPLDHRGLRRYGVCSNDMGTRKANSCCYGLIARQKSFLLKHHNPSFSIVTAFCRHSLAQIPHPLQ